MVYLSKCRAVLHWAQTLQLLAASSDEVGLFVAFDICGATTRKELFRPRSVRWSEGAAVHVACDPARSVEKRKVTAKRRACATPDLRSSPRMRADLKRHGEQLSDLNTMHYTIENTGNLRTYSNTVVQAKFESQKLQPAP